MFHALAIGAAFGFLFMLATGALNFRRILRKPSHAAGVELLEGKEWRSLPGSSWETMKAPLPKAAPHPYVDEASWFLLSDASWLMAKSGSCSPELGGAVLPAIPRCTPEKFSYRFTAANKISDGSLLGLVYHDDDKTFRVWKLTPGAVAWIDTGELPLVAASASLSVGPDNNALIVGGDGVMARYDGQRWSKLPSMQSARVGWEAQITKEGTVIAGGGFPDEKKGDATLSIIVSLAFLAAAIYVARAYKLSIIAMVFGGTLGVGIAIACFFAVWILIGAKI